MLSREVEHDANRRIGIDSSVLEEPAWLFAESSNVSTTGDAPRGRSIVPVASAEAVTGR